MPEPSTKTLNRSASSFLSNSLSARAQPPYFLRLAFVGTGALRGGEAERAPTAERRAARRVGASASPIIATYNSKGTRRMVVQVELCLCCAS